MKILEIIFTCILTATLSFVIPNIGNKLIDEKAPIVKKHKVYGASASSSVITNFKSLLGGGR